MQRSKCRISNADDFCEKFKEFTKDDARKRKAILGAKQRQVDNQKFLDDQKNWKAKSLAKRREENHQQIKDDQNKWKAKSIEKQRDEDYQQVKDNQKKVESKVNCKAKRRGSSAS